MTHGHGVIRVLAAGLVLVGMIAGRTGGTEAHGRGAGPVLRTIAVGASPAAVAVDEQTGRAFVLSMGDGHGRVSVLDAGNGRLLRTVAVGTSPVAVAVDERTNRVFVVDAGSGTVSVLDARSGIVMRTSADHLAPRMVAVDEKTGRVFVTNGAGAPGQGSVTGGGSVSVLDARRGTVLRIIPVGLAPFALAVDEKRGLVFVANQRDNNVSVLDARTGQSLGTVGVGLSPYAVAVDERTGRVVVANSDSKIGRASCRERVEVSERTVAATKEEHAK